MLLSAQNFCDVDVGDQLVFFHCHFETSYFLVQLKKKPRKHKVRYLKLLKGFTHQGTSGVTDEGRVCDSSGSDLV